MIIKSFRKHSQYKFATKIMPNNSWRENVHLFAKDFTIDEIDTISDLYSASEYLDCLVQKISDVTFQSEMDVATYNAMQQSEKVEDKSVTEDTKPPQVKPVLIKVDQPWKKRLEIVTKEIDLLENTPIYSKLAELANYKG